MACFQVFDTVNQEGVYCSLVTGQEKKVIPFAQHVACTIEMANLFQAVEVAVIDEIQVKQTSPLLPLECTGPWTFLQL